MTDIESEENNLVKHARRELELLGEEPEFVEGYLNVIRAFSDMGHSGGSAMVAIPVINTLLQFKNLKPLTNHPEEWYKHEGAGENGTDLWQNKRNSEAFSTDGGRTYQLLSETQGKKKKLHYSRPKDEVVTPN